MAQSGAQRQARYRAANRERLNEDRRKRSKWSKRSIVAWDGEGCNIGDRQLYVLLANSRGDTLVNRFGLTTVDCLNFLCANANSSDINVIFGGSYDANMWMADLPRKNLREIWTTGRTRFAHFFIRYQWRKCFMVKNEETGRTATIWDVLGFFQKSFIETIEHWLPDFDTERMAAMKADRPNFSLGVLDDIISYNAEECRTLVQIVDALFRAFDVAEITLNRYDGAGAVAAAMMTQWGIRRYMGTQPRSVTLAARYAYAGGRIEAPQQGTLYQGFVRRNDKNSAYPTAFRQLPCLSHGYWSHKGEGEWPSVFGVSHIRWDFPEARPFYPFFYREHDGSILFPSSGEGWYWTPELEAISVSDHRYVHVLESFNWHPACTHRPFAAIDEMYLARQRFKADPDPEVANAEFAIKLGMNAMYGKTAQQVGGFNGAPTYHNLCWAGYITSDCRAEMYRAAMQHPESVIAFATDALITTTSLSLPISKSLGDWSEETFDGIVMVQPGVYFLREQGKKWEEKYRGFDRGSLDRDGIIDIWLAGCKDSDCKRHGAHDHYHAWVTRFVGAGSALCSDRWYHHWRTWRTDARLLSLVPAGKRRHDPTLDHSAYGHSLVRTLPSFPLADVCSTPYPLAWEMDGVTSDEEVPAAVLAAEDFDSYA